MFLPGSCPTQAETVAERIRKTINEADFLPDGRRQRLSVSVGGAVFGRHLPFTELFRLADQQLYAAKQNGRNRISLASVTRYNTVPIAAA